MTRQSEYDFHKEALKHLRRILPDDALVWHTPNSGRRGPREHRALSSMGMLAGVPDLLILWNGRLHGLELKRKRSGTLDSAQEAFGIRMQKAGGCYAVVRDLETIETYLDAWAIPLKVRLTRRSA